MNLFTNLIFLFAIILFGFIIQKILNISPKMVFAVSGTIFSLASILFVVWPLISMPGNPAALDYTIDNLIRWLLDVFPGSIVGSIIGAFVGKITD